MSTYDAPRLTPRGRILEPVLLQGRLLLVTPRDGQQPPFAVHVALWRRLPLAGVEMVPHRPERAQPQVAE